MKRFSIIAFLLALSVPVLAGPIDQATPFVFASGTIATNGQATFTTYTNSQPINGFLEAIVWDLGGTASPTVDIDVATTAVSGLGYSRTLLSTNAVTADGIVYVRATPIHNIAGGNLVGFQPTKIPLINDTLYCSVSNSPSMSDTNTATIWLIISK